MAAEVRKEGDTFWLQDLGSANGTRYNGAMVANPIPILAGGEIKIGETTILFLTAKKQVRECYNKAKALTITRTWTLTQTKK